LENEDKRRLKRTSWKQSDNGGNMLSQKGPRVIEHQTHFGSVRGGERIITGVKGLGDETKTSIVPP